MRHHGMNPHGMNPHGMNPHGMQSHGMQSYGERLRPAGRGLSAGSLTWPLGREACLHACCLAVLLLSLLGTGGTAQGSAGTAPFESAQVKTEESAQTDSPQPHSSMSATTEVEAPAEPDEGCAPDPGLLETGAGKSGRLCDEELTNASYP